MGSMPFLTPFTVIQEESDILWKLILLFPDLRVMVSLSNLIAALAVVRNGVPRMKGLFLFSLISKITKSTGAAGRMGRLLVGGGFAFFMMKNGIVDGSYEQTHEEKIDHEKANMRKLNLT
ncbi:hypothetical protein Tco_0484953 [Tanacetum coccineum]